MWDSPANATLNRNKLIVTLDLKTGNGLEMARALYAEADIIIENFRPGKLVELGVEFAEMREARPELSPFPCPASLPITWKNVTSARSRALLPPVPAF